MWKFNNTLLKNQWVKIEIKRKIIKYLDKDKAKNTTYMSKFIWCSKSSTKK